MTTEETPAPLKQDPPPLARREAKDWRAILEPLQKSPGEWFLIATDEWVSTPSRLKAKYGIETRMRNVSPDNLKAAELYARYPEVEDVEK